jgi:hypothetical protein
MLVLVLARLVRALGDALWRHGQRGLQRRRRRQEGAGRHGGVDTVARCRH